MLQRRLEPEVMDTVEEAVDYDAMDHGTVNRLFVDDLLAAARVNGIALDDPRRRILDVGTGTAQIPIELCRRTPDCQVIAIDLAREMLKLGARNVEKAGLTGRIELEYADAKEMRWEDASFDVVMSNSIVHHIPDPGRVLGEMARVTKPGGLLFVRDLLRPDDEDALERIVAAYAGDENEHQQQMFRDSLHAALTLEELASILTDLGLPAAWPRQTSDRHWTICAVR